MSEEIQLQKKNSNEFCYVNFYSRAGKIVVEMDFVNYNPETEENTPIIKLNEDIAGLNRFLKDKNWIVC